MLLATDAHGGQHLRLEIAARIVSSLDADGVPASGAGLDLLAAAAQRQQPRGSFDGFECRWQDIPSRHGETVSLMVLALHHEAERAAEVYREVIAKVREVYGDEEACHPVSLPQLAMTLSGRLLADEAGIRGAGRSAFGRWRWVMHTRLMVTIGWLLMRFGIRTKATDWSRYKPDLARNSDVRKFSDVYRQILAGTEVQRLALEGWLQTEGSADGGPLATWQAQLQADLRSFSGALTVRATGQACIAPSGRPCISGGSVAGSVLPRERWRAPCSPPAKPPAAASASPR